MWKQPCHTFSQAVRTGYLSFGGWPQTRPAPPRVSWGTCSANWIFTKKRHLGSDWKASLRMKRIGPFWRVFWMPHNNHCSKFQSTTHRRTTMTTLSFWRKADDYWPCSASTFFDQQRWETMSCLKLVGTKWRISLTRMKSTVVRSFWPLTVIWQNCADL